jgi:toluene monooxygenase system ferredoxin subunit
MSERQYLKIARVEDFKGIRFKRYTILARHVAIFKEPDGTFFATEISCKHQNADLTTGRFNGDIVTCPRHGWIYNIKTGQCLNQHSAKLRKHDLRIENGEIYISMFPISDDEDEGECS